jgi:ferredoxin
MMDGKADLNGSEEVNTNLFRREVPESDEKKAKSAAESCPVDAIKIYKNGDQIVPSE